MLSLTPTITIFIKRCSNFFATFLKIYFRRKPIFRTLRYITNLRFGDDTDALVEKEQELEALVESLDKTRTKYKLEISTEKTKPVTNSVTGIQWEFKVQTAG